MDPSLLNARTRFNTESSARDVVAWLSSHLRLAEDASILDLGCGTGTQTRKLLTGLGERASVVGLDRSAASIAQFDVGGRQLACAWRGVTADMGELADPTRFPELTEFSHILCLYSLYYAPEPASLVEALRDRLRAGGVLVVAGPIPGNNAAWYRLLTRAGVELPAWLLDVSEHFMEAIVLPTGARFARARYEKLSNPVRFTDAARLMEYWRSNIYRAPERDEAVRQAINAHFAAAPHFIVTKKIGMISLEEPV